MFKNFNQGGNPLLKNALTNTPPSVPFSMMREESMTVQGTINKTLILFAILMVTATFNYQAQIMVLTVGGAIAGLILVLIGVFKRQYSPVIAPIYAALEGLFVGGISGLYAGFGGGIIIQAVSLTLLVLFIMLFIHKTGIIPVTQKLRMGIVMATGAIALLYLATMVLGFFGINVPYIHEGGTIGIIFSLVVIGVASMNLLLDFDSIVKGQEYGAPKFMEWFSAMGLMITLIWLYIEILRLLGKMRD